jgi:hypothetical protein
MFHPKHVAPFAGNKILYKKKCHLVGTFLKFKIKIKFKWKWKWLILRVDCIGRNSQVGSLEIEPSLLF